jgi:hypothetical protein
LVPEEIRELEGFVQRQRATPFMSGVAQSKAQRFVRGLTDGIDTVTSLLPEDVGRPINGLVSANLQSKLKTMTKSQSFECKFRNSPP